MKHKWKYELGSYPVCKTCGLSIYAGAIKSNKRTCFINVPLRELKKENKRLNRIINAISNSLER